MGSVDAPDVGAKKLFESQPPARIVRDRGVADQDDFIFCGSRFVPSATTATAGRQASAMSRRLFLNMIILR
jgi:hypothetical protein